VADVAQDSSDWTASWTPGDLESFRIEREWHLRDWQIRAMAHDLAELCETERDMVNAIGALGKELRRRWNEPDGYLYVLGGELGGVKVYKIGHAGVLSNRIAQIRPQLPFPVEVVYAFKCEHRIDAETYFHRRFAQKRMEGEWFKLDEEDLGEFEKFKGRGILYSASHDHEPVPWEPRTRPEWEEPFVDEVTEKIV
jgi:hypothetical protein